jgi:hypothetical protein
MAIEVRDEFRSFLGWHILSAFATVILFLGVLLLNRFRDRTWGKVIYHLFLMMGLGAVLSAGFFGGELVHRFNVSTLAGN